MTSSCCVAASGLRACAWMYKAGAVLHAVVVQVPLQATWVTMSDINPIR